MLKLLRRLNNYGITRDEFNQALAKLNSEMTLTKLKINNKLEDF